LIGANSIAVWSKWSPRTCRMALARCTEALAYLPRLKSYRR
jgi:hypothetical protein